MDRARAALSQLKQHGSGPRDVFEAACRDILEHVQSTRASIWTFENAGDRIRCRMLLDSRHAAPMEGMVLERRQYAPYFHEILTVKKVIAPEAQLHPATACFQDGYFDRNDIRSLLDHVVFDAGQPVAVLCCEHCGAIKEWTAAHMQYLQAVAALIGICFRMSRVSA